MENKENETQQDEENVVVWNEEDLELYNLLSSWKLHDLFDKLKSQKCYVSVLKVMKAHHIEKVLTEVPIGKVILFEHSLESWRKEINQPLVGLSKENINIRSKPSSDGSHNKSNINLIDILNNTGTGLDLLEYYKEHKLFKEAQRKVLINLIDKYIEDLHLSLSLGESYRLETQILNEFPSEKLEYYRTTKRGRIYAKVCNSKNKVNKVLQVSTSTAASINNSHMEFIPEEDYESIRNSLKDDKLEEDEFFDYWRKCSEYRFSQIEKCKTAADIFKLWPEYLEKNAIRMFDIDFSIKYPHSENIHENWALHSEKIEDLLKKRVPAKSINGINLNSLGEETRENTREIIILMNLHQLLLSPKTGGGKATRKYSVEDSLGAFAIFAETNEEMEDKLRHICSIRPFLQPCILVIGDINMIKEIFVYVDGMRFKTMYILHAVDMCFKIFFVFNLKYPEAANFFWIFLEYFFYKINFSKTNVKVATLCNELNSI